MNKYLLTFLFVASTSSSFCQQNKYQGTYSNGHETTESPGQFLEINYSKKGEILFYLEVSRGAPSYNSGALYGRLVKNKLNGHLQYVPIDTANDCTLDFIKSGNKITIKTVHGDCQFGHAVYADGVYKLRKNSNPLYFDDRAGKRIYFYKTSPEKYQQKDQ